jgi:hypothetical protein
MRTIVSCKRSSVVASMGTGFTSDRVSDVRHVGCGEKNETATSPVSGQVAVY